MYNWATIRETIEIEEEFERSASVKAAYRAQTDKQRAEFIASVKRKIREQGYYFAPNAFPYDVEPQIRHYVYWYESNEFHPMRTIHKQIPKETDYLVMWNEEVHKSVPEVEHCHVFISNVPRERRLPKYLAHATSMSAFLSMMKTVIGNEVGFICAPYNMDILRIEHKPDDEEDAYNGIYFTPVFTDTLEHDKYSGDIILVLAPDVLEKQRNWHYNRCDTSGIVTESTVFNHRNIYVPSKDEDPEVVFYDAIPFRNISVILTGNERLLGRRTIMGIPVQKSISTPVTLPVGYLPPVPHQRNTDVKLRHKASIDQFTYSVDA